MRKSFIICAFFFLTCISKSVISGDLLSLPSSVVDPVANMSNPAKVLLGNALYFDKRLSSDGTIACASCHLPDQGGDDNLPVSPGIGSEIGTRNAQGVFNTGFMSAQFWDGRAPTLEEQAKQPFINPVEMGLENHDAVVTIVESIDAYQVYFDAAFGLNTVITIDEIVEAIAAFERTLLTPNSPFDNYINGDTGAMTADQVAGMDLFIAKGCDTCHDGALFARQRDPGMPFLKKFPEFPANVDFIALNAALGLENDLLLDLGRGATTSFSVENNFWKVQSLRNIDLTAPYFHNGSVETLTEAVKFMATGQLDMVLTETEGKTLITDEEISLIVDFLGALTGDIPNPEPMTEEVAPDNYYTGTSALSPLLVLVLFSFISVRVFIKKKSKMY